MAVIKRYYRPRLSCRTRDRYPMSRGKKKAAAKFNRRAVAARFRDYQEYNVKVRIARIARSTFLRICIHIYLRIIYIFIYKILYILNFVKRRISI